MSLVGDYDPANVFAKIIRREIPAAVVYEDDRSLAFMDAFPQVRGHTLVIPKRVNARTLFDIPTSDLQELIGAVQKVARAVEAALRPDGVVISQFSGAPAGQTIFHIHFHILPRWSGVAVGRHGAEPADAEDLRQLAALIAARL
jgi:histidine triad (HIT) family protein